jgi:hypothetical protein
LVVSPFTADFEDEVPALRLEDRVVAFLGLRGVILTASHDDIKKAGVAA